MARKQNKALTGLLAAAGAVSAYFGARALVSWMQRRREDLPFQAGDSAESIPPTGMPETAWPEAGVPSPSRPQGYMPEAYLPGAGMPQAGASEQPAIPPTGVMRPDVVDMPRTEAFEQGDAAAGAAAEPVPVGSLVGPLVVHLLIFHNMVDMLHRRRDTLDSTAGSATELPDVRAGGADAIESLEAQLPEFDRSALARGSLQERIVELMERIRDALGDTGYSDEQLFHIHDALRRDACKALDLIHKDGEDGVTGFVEVKQAYACR